MRWPRMILDVAMEEMGHLVVVRNITAALGAAPRIGCINFPLDPGYLPPGLVVKLALFNPKTLQHFTHLARPPGPTELDEDGYAPEWRFAGRASGDQLTPMSLDCDAADAICALLGEGLRRLIRQGRIC